MRLYNIWAYSHYTGDWVYVENNWSSIEVQIPGSTSSDNGDVANLIGGYRMAVHMSDSDATTYLNRATASLQSRLTWESNNPVSNNWLGENDSSAFCDYTWAHGCRIHRYNNMTYELGRVLYQYAQTPMTVQDSFIRSAIPSQVVTRGWYPVRGEGFENRPHQARDVWAQKAFIMQLPDEDLTAYISSTWCKGDLYYIERLAWTAMAAKALEAPRNLQIISIQ
jgi:hypothetical protein